MSGEGCKSGSWVAAADTLTMSPLIRFLPVLPFFVAHAWLYRRFTIDDAFIAFRVVKQWTGGNGIVYNVGERVEAYSSFLWLVLLALCDRLGVDLVLASKLLGVSLGVLTLVVVYRIARDLEMPEVAPWLLATSAPFAAWTMGGLETTLFAFVVLVAAAAFVREERRGRGWLSGIAFGVLTLTRPEGIALAAATIGFRAGRLLLGARGGRHDVCRLLALMAIVLPYHLWRLLYYGHLFPNTAHAKFLGLHPRALLEGLYYLQASLSAAGGFFFIASCMTLAVSRPGRGIKTPFLLVSVVAYFGLVVAGGADWMPMQRLLVHVLPLVCLLSHAGIVQLGRAIRPPLGLPLVALLVVGQLGYQLAMSLDQRFVRGVGEGSKSEGRDSIRYLRDHVRPDDTVALINAGVAGYAVPLRTQVVDMVGLADSHIAHLAPRFPNGLFGRGDGFGKWDVEYILSRRPDFVQIDVRDRTPDGLWRTGFTGTELLVNDSRFQAEYEIADQAAASDIFVRRVRGVRPAAAGSAAQDTRP